MNILHFPKDIRAQWDLKGQGANIMGCTAVENRMTISQKIKHRISYDLAVPLLGKYPNELKAVTQVFVHQYS